MPRAGSPASDEGSRHDPATRQPVPPAQAAPRDAATIILLRDTPGGLEVCMLRRHLDSGFVGGAYVFPGGKVDLSDRSEVARALCAGRSDADASERLGVCSGGLAFFVAALRECFEEAGILLAYPAGATAGALYRPRDEAADSRLGHFRAEVNSGRVSFVEACRSARVMLAVDKVEYFSHWITPEAAPARYDTRFFVALVPPGQTALHDDFETTDTIWVRPAEALAKGETGELDLMLPTMANLRAVSVFETASEVIAAAASAGSVPTVLPRVVARAGGLRLLLPGDPGYEAGSTGTGAIDTGAIDTGSIDTGAAVTREQLAEAVRKAGIAARTRPK